MAKLKDSPRPGRPPAKVLPPLSAAWHYSLMVGEPPPVRVAGWVSQLGDAVKRGTVYDYTAHGDRLWSAHADQLVEEARTAGFTPYWEAKKKPSGVSFLSWQTRFLAKHTY